MFFAILTTFCVAMLHAVRELKKLKTVSFVKNASKNKFYEINSLLVRKIRTWFMASGQILVTGWLLPKRFKYIPSHIKFLSAKYLEISSKHIPCDL